MELNKNIHFKTKIINLNNFQYLLLIFFPAFLITGPFLTDLAVSTLALIFLFQSFKEKIFGM